MATHDLTTPTSLARRWLPRFGGASARRQGAAAPQRRSILALLAQGAAAMALPSAVMASPSPVAARPAYAPTLLASDPAKTTPRWQDAQQEAMTLAAELRQARADLEQRIGPRGLVLGSLTLPSGRTVPLHASSPDAAKKLWRRLQLGAVNDPERAGVMAAVRAACDQWDAQAERAGLSALERRAAGARDRAAALLKRAAAA